MAAHEGYVTEIARLFPKQGHWREEDYFALPETTQIVELKDGVVIVSPALDDDHQDTVVQLLTLLNVYVLANQLGTVRVAPYDVRLAPGLIRQPDVLFIRHEHRSRIQEGILNGAPDWVAEVVSPGSRQTDEVEKLAEYRQAGVPEYWLLDPRQRTIRVYVLREGASDYTLAATYTSGQTARSETIAGFEVTVDSIFLPA